jgi:hypothetical protein
MLKLTSTRLTALALAGIDAGTATVGAARTAAGGAMLLLPPPRGPEPEPAAACP